MRSLLVVLLLLFGAAFGSISGRVLPLTVKEVCLMLRSGYSSEAVQRELSVRHLAEACDAAGEAALKGAGASPSLIEAVKNGAYQTSPADALAAIERQRAQAQRQAAETERLRKMDRLYRTLPPREPTTPSAVETGPVVANLLKGDLVYSRNGSLAPYDDGGLENKKIIALYFSAQWCGPCRKFTPKLVEYYNRVIGAHPEFELIFMSSDRSAFGMESYMRQLQMPWPAVNFGKLSSKQALTKYKGDGIPCLVVLDASGKVLAHTYEGTTFLGPEKVLETLDAIFARGTGGQVAQTR